MGNRWISTVATIRFMGDDSLRCCGWNIHFDVNSNTGVWKYFRVLLLCQEFERAVAFLARSGHLTDAVHFAIVLDHYGVLMTPDHPQNDLHSGEPVSMIFVQLYCKLSECVDGIMIESTIIPNRSRAYCWSLNLVPSLFYALAVSFINTSTR